MLFVGRLVPQKNVQTLIKALAHLSGIQLHIIGDGPQLPILQQAINKHRVHAKIITSVPNKKLPSYYNQADIYVQPSLYEGSPKTILEAMSCGLPVIAARVPGIADLIRHKETGYLCEPTAASLRAAIVTLLHDATLRNTLGKQARRFIEQHHSVPEIVSKEIALYTNA